MEPKEYDIEFPRGDTCPLKFSLLDEGKSFIKLSETDEMYFTVKKSYGTNEYILQKRFSKQEISEDGDGYTLTIMPEDTNNLNYGTYVYDLYVKSGDLTRTVCMGQITLTNEVTFISNE